MEIEWRYDGKRKNGGFKLVFVHREKKFTPSKVNTSTPHDVERAINRCIPRSQTCDSRATEIHGRQTKWTIFANGT